MSVPTIQSYIPLKPGEESISAWKTRPVDRQDQRTWVQITEGSDGNEDILGRIVEVVRFEFGGGKIIFHRPGSQ